MKNAFIFRFLMLGLILIGWGVASHAQGVSMDELSSTTVSIKTLSTVLMSLMSLEMEMTESSRATISKQ